MKRILVIFLLLTVTTYSQITVNAGSDLVVRKNDQVTLTANVKLSSELMTKTLLDSIIENEIPLVYVDTNNIHFGDFYQYHHDIIHIVDFIHNYQYPNPYAILALYPPEEKNSNVAISLSGTILDNGNYQRMVVVYNHNNAELLGENIWGHMYDEYMVNPISITEVPPGRYILFFTNGGYEWNVIVELNIEYDPFNDKLYYIWSTGETTKTIEVIVVNDSIISVEVSKRGNTSKDVVMIKSNE